MSLEKIVNFLLKPLEEIAQAVYDVAYLEREEIIIDNNGKEAIRKVYTSNDTGLKHYLDLLRVDYKTSRDMFHDITTRPLDKYFKREPKKSENKITYTTRIGNFVDGYNAHPVLYTLAFLLALCYI